MIREEHTSLLIMSDFDGAEDRPRNETTVGEAMQMIRMMEGRPGKTEPGESPVEVDKFHITESCAIHRLNGGKIVPKYSFVGLTMEQRCPDCHRLVLLLQSLR